MMGANIKDIDPLITLESNEIKQITWKKKTFIKGLAVNGVIQNEPMKPAPTSPVSNPH